MNSAPERRNSPIVLVAVLVIVLVGVLLVAVVGKVASKGLTTVVTGTALAVGEDTPRVRTRSEQPTNAEIAANQLLVPGSVLPAVDCVLPGFGTVAAELRAFYLAGVRCLDEAWRPTLRAAGLPFAAPNLDVSDRPTGRCGFSPPEDEATAFYCSRDSTIYMPRGRLLRDAGSEPGHHLAVLAHEYGHHVQSLSGILDDAGSLESGVDEEDSLEVSRRTELQANCFAGLFLAASDPRGTGRCGRPRLRRHLGNRHARHHRDPGPLGDEGLRRQEHHRVRHLERPARPGQLAGARHDSSTRSMSARMRSRASARSTPAISIASYRSPRAGSPR
jgi:uncharacterized protein